MEPALSPKETVDLKSYLFLLWRRKWVVVIPTILAAIVAFIVTLPSIMKPIYESSSTLMMEFPRPLSRELASLLPNPSLDEQMARLDAQIQGNEFLVKVIETTGMRDDPSIRDWARKNQKRYPDLTFEELVDLRLIRYLRGVVRTSAGGRGRNATNLIQVAVYDYYPGRARTLVQNITSGIIEANRSEQLRLIKSTGDFSATQLQEYQAKLTQAEERLEAYRRSLLRGRVEPPLVTENTMMAVREAEQKAGADAGTMETIRAAAAGEARSAGLAASRLEAAFRGSEIQGLLASARDMENTYVRQHLLELASTSSAASPASRATAILLARQVDRIRDVGVAALAASGELTDAQQAAAESWFSAAARAALARERRAAYQGHMGQYTSFLASVPEAEMELQRLTEDVETYRELQNAFLAQVSSSQITEAFGSSKLGEKITVLEPAQHPLKPVRPKRLQIILMSILGGLGLGVAAAFFVEHHDPSYRDVNEIEREFRLRVVGTMPDMPGLSRLSHHSRSAPGPLKAGAAERAIQEFLRDSPGYQECRRIALSLLDRAAGRPYAVMVTSARRGEGKSLTSACLALTIAREIPNERVLLVDLDLHKAQLSPFFGVDGVEPDTLVSLTRRRWTDEGLKQLPVENLRLLPVRGFSEKPEGIVSAEGVHWLLEEAKKHAQWIIVDSPPNLPVPDALIIGREVDSVLMVVKAGETPRETVRRGIDAQRRFGDNLHGIVLNNCEHALPYYYHYSHYGYRYAQNG